MIVVLRTICWVLTLLSPLTNYGQLIVNGDLEGTQSLTIPPNGWVKIPHTDLICQAIHPYQATPDVVTIYGPASSYGIAGIPQSGISFVSGLHMWVSWSQLWHEGIMQTISGFTIGANYDLSFYQAIVKQYNNLDQSGSWRVYRDSTLIFTSTPSFSELTYNDVNIEWELRSVNFTATDTIHTLKFIPWDDDPNIESSIVNISGGLRMGIDNIQLIDNGILNPDSELVELPNIFTPNNDNINDFFTLISEIKLNIKQIIIINRWGNIVYSGNDPAFSWDGKSKDIDCIPGVYFWKIDYLSDSGVPKSQHGNVTLIR